MKRQHRQAIELTAVGLTATYLIWGLRGLAFVVSLPISYVLGLLLAMADSCVVANHNYYTEVCSHSYLGIGIALGLLITGLATAFPRQFFMVLGFALLAPLLFL